MTILPEEKTGAVVRGFRMRMMSAWNRFWLYSVFQACVERNLRSSRQPRSTVATTFWISGSGQSGLMRSRHEGCGGLSDAVAEVDGEWLRMMYGRFGVRDFVDEILVLLSSTE